MWYFLTVQLNDFGDMLFLLLVQPLRAGHSVARLDLAPEQLLLELFVADVRLSRDRRVYIILLVVKVARERAQVCT